MFLAFSAGAVMLFHHLLSLYGQCVVLIRGRDGVEMMAVLFGSEFSNPFLQFRWFLRESGHHKTWLAEINDHLFMFTFGFWRIIIGTILLYCTLTHPLPDLHAKLGGVAIYLVGWIFWFMIVKYAIRKYRKKYKARAEEKESFEANKDKSDTVEHNGRASNGVTATPRVNRQSRHSKND